MMISISDVPDNLKWLFVAFGVLYRGIVRGHSKMAFSREALEHVPAHFGLEIDAHGNWVITDVADTDCFAGKMLKASPYGETVKCLSDYSQVQEIRLRTIDSDWMYIPITDTATSVIPSGHARVEVQSEQQAKLVPGKYYLIEYLESQDMGHYYIRTSSALCVSNKRRKSKSTLAFVIDPQKDEMRIVPKDAG